MSRGIKMKRFFILTFAISVFLFTTVVSASNEIISGDRPIINNINNAIQTNKDNLCPLLNGTVKYGELNLNELPSKPKIWTQEKILIRKNAKETDNEVLKKLLESDPEEVLENTTHETVEPEPVALSGSKVSFENAAKLDGWLLQWGRNSNSSLTSQGNKSCAVYFTGVGCPHCAKADPVALPQMTEKYPEYMVIEYEIYQLRENAPLIQKYASEYDTDLGVPLIIFSREEGEESSISLTQISIIVVLIAIVSSIVWGLKR